MFGVSYRHHTYCIVVFNVTMEFVFFVFAREHTTVTMTFLIDSIHFIWSLLPYLHVAYNYLLCS